MQNRLALCTYGAFAIWVKGDREEEEERCVPKKDSNLSEGN